MCWFLYFNWMISSHQKRLCLHRDIWLSFKWCCLRHIYIVISFKCAQCAGVASVLFVFPSRIVFWPPFFGSELTLESECEKPKSGIHPPTFLISSSNCTRIYITPSSGYRYAIYQGIAWHHTIIIKRERILNYNFYELSSSF